MSKTIKTSSPTINQLTILTNDFLNRTFVWFAVGIRRTLFSFAFLHYLVLSVQVIAEFLPCSLQNLQLTSTHQQLPLKANDHAEKFSEIGFAGSEEVFRSRCARNQTKNSLHGSK
jgi:hypothetical protein